MRHIFKNALVCVDALEHGLLDTEELSAPSASVLRVAQALHESDGCGLTVACVLPEDTDDALVDDVRERLAARAAPEVDGKDVDVWVGRGMAFVEIIRKVMRDDHDLVLVAARQHSVIHRSIVGSTALKLMRKCPCPVWVTPRQFVRGPKVVLSAAGFHGLTPMILDLSERVVSKAGGDWHVLHCMEYPEEGAMRLRKAPATRIAEYHAEAKQVAWKRLHELCDGYTDPEPRLWLAEGQPDEQVVRAIHELGVDVVVMGIVGRVGVPGLIMGNTAEKILQLVECSVLAVKPEGFVSPIEPA